MVLNKVKMNRKTKQVHKIAYMRKLNVNFMETKIQKIKVIKRQKMKQIKF